MVLIEESTLNKIKNFVKKHKNKIFAGLALAGAGAAGYAGYKYYKQSNKNDKVINELKEARKVLRQAKKMQDKIKQKVPENIIEREKEKLLDLKNKFEDLIKH